MLKKIESFISNMRWKAHFFLNNRINPKETFNSYGFNFNGHSPCIEELDNFETNLIGLVKRIKCKKVNNNIQQQIKKDLGNIRSSKEIFVKADKFSLLYKISPNKYNNMIYLEVIKHYKKAAENLEVGPNKEASKFNMDNKIEKFNIKQCFITLKDNKHNFYSKPEYRLINPTKTQMGRTSKIKSTY